MSVKIENKRILESAIAIAERDGFGNIVRQQVAIHAGVSNGKVSNAYGTMGKLKRAVMRHAIKNNNITIIMAGLAVSDPTALKMTEEDKQEIYKQFLQS